MATLYYRPYTSEPITDGDLPAENAVESVLPEYEYIFPAPNPHRGGGGTHRPAQPRRRQQQPAVPPEASAELGELDRYKDAMRKMGQDILALRDRVHELELENAALKRDVGRYKDPSELLGDGPDFDDVPKADLIARYAAMKNKLVSTASQVGQYREKVQQLQNELIRKGQGGGGGGGLGAAHASQQRLIQQLQEKAEKVKRLEGACLKQEQVIERMERLLQDPPAAAGGGRNDETLSKALTEENRRLRDELARLRNDRSAADRDAGMDDAERLELYQLLDRAETRIASLEKQVAEKSRDWAREKERLTDRLDSLRGGKTGGRQHGPSHRKERPEAAADEKAAAAAVASKRAHRRL